MSEIVGNGFYVHRGEVSDKRRAEVRGGDSGEGGKGEERGGRGHGGGAVEYLLFVKECKGAGGGGEGKRRNEDTSGDVERV
ncbi:hypothetical protein L6164_007163 [Bauhinia variegata]|uniref:Uncharacterized protein n=1 Tax=Bauhinia variegata TaxID=167791 RepID=A0ACB9PW69_BAUVA|nr:hypothetical protein L6164_007163 [Bauhinia variegata]